MTDSMLGSERVSLVYFGAMGVLALVRPGWQALGIIVGLAFVYLGVASISLPFYAGSWNLWGGALATVGGWAFIGATLWQARQLAAAAD